MSGVSEIRQCVCSTPPATATQLMYTYQPSQWLESLKRLFFIWLFYPLIVSLIARKVCTLEANLLLLCLVCEHLLFPLQLLSAAFLFAPPQVLYAEECQVGTRGDVRPHREVSGTPQPSWNKTTTKQPLSQLSYCLCLYLRRAKPIEIIILFSSCVSLAVCLPFFPFCSHSSLLSDLSLLCCHPAGIILCLCFPPHSQSGSRLADLKLHISSIYLACAKRLSAERLLLLGTLRLI